MILTSHIIISGLIGSRIQNYFLAAVIGFVSHYILDAIPHWDFYISSEKFKKEAGIKKWGFLKEKYFWKEMSKIITDILIGSVFLFLFLNKIPYQNIKIVLVAAIFGILPDAANLIYFITKWRLLKPNYDLQYNIQKTKLGFWPGILIQIAAVAIVLIAVIYL